MGLIIPRNRIAHETLDGEVVILDQDAGAYFSLTGSGVDIWALIEAGVDPDAMAAILAPRMGTEASRIAAAVAGLVARLVAERLVEDDPAAIAAATGAVPPTPNAAWVEPLLERFDDLRELLVVDPIHDVDEAGWPHKAADEA